MPAIDNINHYITCKLHIYINMSVIWQDFASHSQSFPYSYFTSHKSQ